MTQPISKFDILTKEAGATMKRIFVIFGILLSLFISCSDEESTEVNIRIKNVSSENYQNVSVLTFSLENLESGDLSEYRQFERAYRIASVSLEIDGENFDLQIIDFVGEEPLESGNYTYEIGLNQNGDSLTFDLVKE